MARTSVFSGRVMLKAFCQKSLRLSIPAPFFFGSFLFGRTKRNEHLKKEGVLFVTPSLEFASVGQSNHRLRTMVFYIFGSIFLRNFPSLS